jgi:hypothetical protein
MKAFFQIFIASITIGAISFSFADGYDRKDFNYRSYKPNTSIGFYTNKTCDFPRHVGSEVAGGTFIS